MAVDLPASDPSATIEIKGSRGKLALLVLAGVVMTAGSLWVLTLDEVHDGSLRAYKGLVASAIGVPFFGACTLVALRRLITAGRTIVTITPTGITDTRVASREIPWAAVQNVGVWTYKRQKAIVVKVPPELEGQLELTRMARWTRRANAALGADGFCLTAQGLQTTHDQLYEMCIAYAEAARGH